MPRRLGRCAARALRGSLALLLAIGAAGVVHAATDLGAPRSPAEQCLSPAAADRVKPVYPPAMLEIKRDATVDVRLTFDGPQSAPSVAFVSDASDDFRRSVEDYARQLRVPCMATGAAPVMLSQTFSFVPNDGRKVALTLPVATRRAGKACGVRMGGEGLPLPEYPAELVKRGKEGSVVLKLRFVDPAQPPEITVLDNGGDKLFAHAVRPAVEALRMTCLGKEPAEIQVVYNFFLDGEAQRWVLKDTTLTDFIHAVKPFPRGQTYFDTTRMKCPFDVRLTFRQPWNPNRIEELEEDVESRHAFLNWLSTLELDVPPRQANHVLGQSMVIEVPCAKIDL